MAATEETRNDYPVPEDPGFVARFTRETYAATQLVHHNVIQIYDIGEDRGTHFFSMSKSYLCYLV